MNSMKSMRFLKDNFYGTATVGERGQVVIPVGARKNSDIKPGTKLLFFGHREVLHMMRADKMEKFLERISQKFAAHLTQIKKISKRVTNG